MHLLGLLTVRRIVSPLREVSQARCGQTSGSLATAAEELSSTKGAGLLVGLVADATGVALDEHRDERVHLRSHTGPSPD
jgi:hypothetical protein